MTQNTNEILHVIGTDLLDYSFKVQKAISDGWTFSDKSEYAPRAWPHMFEAWMVKVGTTIDDSNSQMVVERSESFSVAFKESYGGVDTNNENKAVVEPSKGVPKQTNRRNAKK